MIAKTVGIYLQNQTQTRAEKQTSSDLSTTYMHNAQVFEKPVRESDRQTVTQAYRHTDTQTHRHTDTQTHRHTKRKTHRHTKRKTHSKVLQSCAVLLYCFRDFSQATQMSSDGNRIRYRMLNLPSLSCPR